VPLSSYLGSVNSVRSLMKAAVYRRYGPPDVVRIEEVPRPDPKTNELLVRVRATTVSAGDSRLRSAQVPPGFGVLLRLGFGIFGPRKHTLGWEFAGEVAAVGPAVARFAPGDRVFGTRMGSHAEYVVAPESSVAPIPPNLTFEDAAALVFGGTTGLSYLRDKAKIQPGERILINGASGAVGTAAVQLAKHFGAAVTGVCSAANAELVRSLGADRVIDYAREDFTHSDETYDVILDTVGNCTFERCKQALAPGGRLLLVVASLGQMLGAMLRASRSGRQVLTGVSATRVQDLVFLGTLAESGALKPVIDRTYPLARIVDAHSYADTGRKRGSVVVTP
jgi:NADPH:quinone reductase-like Zn-dependent oxidoreductase